MKMETVSSESKVFSAVNNLAVYGNIIALRRVSDNDYVVLREWSDVNPWVTHRMYFRNGEACYESGHYFYPDQEQEAWDDFRTR